MSRINVELDTRRYPIIIGAEIRDHELPRLIQRHLKPGGRLFVVFDAQVYALYGPAIMSLLATTDRCLTEMVIPPGEKSKSPSELQGIYDLLLTNRFSRNAFVLAVGGGVTTDLAGYAAATILRGIPWGAVPTTLLGMVDAAIGGKTGINHSLGKNLIGAFWQPSFVLADIGFLPTLPPRELIAGLGEVAKYAGLMGERFMKPLESYLDRGDLLDPHRLSRLVTLSAEYKADIVARDEREGRLRMLLNLGHTIGHAVEHAVGYGKLLHGEAVLLGLDAMIEVSALKKPARRAKLAAYQSLIRRLIAALPRRRISPEAVFEAISLDKKRDHATARFVLLDAPGRPLISHAVPESLIREAIAALLEHYESKGGRHAQNSRR